MDRIDDGGGRWSRARRAEWNEDRGGEGPGPGPDEAHEPKHPTPARIRELVRRLVASSTSAMVVLDGDGLVVDRNDAVAGVLNIHPDDVANGRYRHLLDLRGPQLVVRDDFGAEHHYAVQHQRIHLPAGKTTVVAFEPVAGPGRPRGWAA